MTIKEVAPRNKFQQHRTTCTEFHKVIQKMGKLLASVCLEQTKKFDVVITQPSLSTAIKCSFKEHNA
jgi:hypothetical protein